MDTSRSTLFIAALVSAVLVSLLGAANVFATHQNLYQTTMTPPTHETGTVESYNSCGWHVGSCLNNQNGAALDWGYLSSGISDTNVRFRGWAYRSGTGFSNGYLILNVFQWRSGSTVCDEAVADVIEILPWKVRYGMHYTHSYISAGGGVGLYVSGSGIGAWNSPIVAHMIDDSGGCPWTALHVHEQAVPVALSYYYENRTSTYPCCNYGGSYHPNNVEAHKTHVTQFQQGH